MALPANEEGDIRLMENVRKGNTAAFSLLYEKYFDRLNRYAYHMVMSEASLDIVQDVFTTLWTTQVEINGGSVLPQPVKCFLRHIICHVIILEIIVRIIPYLIKVVLISFLEKFLKCGFIFHGAQSSYSYWGLYGRVRIISFKGKVFINEIFY